MHVPDESEEAVRDLLRCREDVRRDAVRWRHRLVKFLDRHGWLYVTGKNWTQGHWAWIRAQRFVFNLFLNGTRTSVLGDSDGWIHRHWPGYAAERAEPRPFGGDAIAHLAQERFFGPRP